MIKPLKKSLKKLVKLIASYLMIRKKLTMISLDTQHLKVAEVAEALVDSIHLHSQTYLKISLVTLQEVHQEDLVVDPRATEVTT